MSVACDISDSWFAAAACQICKFAVDGNGGVFLIRVSTGEARGAGSSLKH